MLKVYILTSLKNPSKTYIGITHNLENRLHQHNNPSNGYSKRFAPWKLETYIKFHNDHLAYKFEKYLKSGSGQAFLKKHFLSPLVSSSKLPCLA